MVAIINKEGYKFIFPTLIAVALSVYFNLHFVSYLFIIITGFFAFFFRDPERIVPKQKGILVSPADGTIKRIITYGKYQEIYIFLRPLDVHINRAPLSGIIHYIEHKRGKHKMAFRKSATMNEENYISIKSGKFGVTVVQVVGFMARRIRCWVKVFDKVEMGQKIGMLIFGSGTKLIMPRNAKILVKEKQIVKAGETIVAKL